MKFALAAIVSTLVFLAAVPPAQAGQKEFCAGFEEGYKAINGTLAIVPICPIAPITPIGSTDFREGIKAGMAREIARVSAEALLESTSMFCDDDGSN